MYSYVYIYILLLFKGDGVGLRVEGHHSPAFTDAYSKVKFTLEATQGKTLRPISHRYHPILVSFVWELTTETIDLPMGCLQGGVRCGFEGHHSSAFTDAYSQVKV